ncbi:MAG: rRNA adenine N-6-methyltransferase family protein [Microgenomates group bacterium]|nr:rRNA adenine N-6-methyltransferase family protein [Microgenomates group bacterium]
MIYFLMFFELIIAFFLAFYFSSLIYSQLKGAMFVPSNKKEIKDILQIANLKKNDFFLDLGSGDGRVLITAAKYYNISGLGIEINPMLLLISNFFKKIHRLNKIKFIRQDILKANISQADVIYMFLWPDLIDKIKDKIKKQAKKNLLVISHGFKIDGWSDYLFTVLKHHPFPTYFYRLS